MFKPLNLLFEIQSQEYLHLPFFVAITMSQNS